MDHVTREVQTMRGPDYVILDVEQPMVRLNEAIALSLEHADFVIELGGTQEYEVLNYLDDIIQCLEYGDTGLANLRDYVDSLMRQEHEHDMSQYRIAEKVYALGEHIRVQLWHFNMYEPEGFIRYFFFERFPDAIVLMHNDAVPSLPGAARRKIDVGSPPGVCSY
jgi:hypothetical protein